MIRSFLNKIIYYFITILSRKLKAYNKVEANNRKEQIISKLQSVGYGFKLNADSFIIRGAKNIIIGNNVHIGNNIFIAGEGGLIIKDNTHISRNVTIYTVNHNYKGAALPYDNSTVYKPVTIGKNVWIGMNVSILPGTVIEDGAIIGMGSVVNRTIKKNEIVGNSSLLHIKYRSDEHYNTLENEKFYGGVNGKILPVKRFEKYNSTYFHNKKKEIIFVLGTGRSGSKSIVDILNENPANFAIHEDIGQLIRISTELAYDQANKYKYYTELEDIFNTKVWQANNDQVLIHSDQRLWNLVHFLKHYFPNSKFIHLKREAVSCIKSMITRGWYMDNEYPLYFQHDWAKFRLQADTVGEYSTAEWNNFSQSQKCTWYWYFINQSIERELLELPNSRVLSLNLTGIEEELEKLSTFVNSNAFNLRSLKSNQVRTSDVVTYNQLENSNIDDQISDFLAELDLKANRTL